MRTSATRRALLGGATAIAALPFVASRHASAASPGVLTFGLSSYPPSIKPWANTGTAAATIKLMIYRGLTSYAPDGSLRGELAESWGRAGDTGWEFKLRDAVFQNGEKVTSSDVKWTIEQIAAKGSTAYFRTQMGEVAGVETPDERTVRIMMKNPVSMLPTWMASYHLPIISRASGAGEPVGAGPFRIVAQERGVSIELEPFAKFHRQGLPRLKRIRAVAYADENLRVAALRAGDVDLIEYVPWQAMEAISADPKLSLDTTDGAFMFLVFNGSRPPFNDPRVRKAVAHAIRREDIVKAAFFGRGSALQQLPISPSSAYYNADFKDGWRYDPELAKKLLAAAGASGAKCSLLSTAQYGMHKNTAEVVQQHLAAVGLQAELNLPDWATRVATGNRGQYDIAVMGTAADSNDPDGISNFVDGSLSASYVRSYGLKTPRISELYAAGRAEFDEAKRRAIYREIERIAIDEAPIVGLSWRSQGYAMRKGVTGFKNLPGALTFYSGTTFETADVS